MQEIKNKTPEFKKTKAYECFNLLAKVINFESTVRIQNILVVFITMLKKILQIVVLLSFIGKELEQASISKKVYNFKMILQ